jgi:hypothetical protein
VLKGNEKLQQKVLNTIVVKDFCQHSSGLSGFILK